MPVILAVALYAAAMVSANLLVVAFGPVVVPFNAFFLIGLDLALRDWLHLRLRVWQMGALIGAAGLLTYLLNPAAQNIAIASSAAFACAAVVDWLTFAAIKGNFLRRSLVSNVPAAAVDSLVFPLVAFGSLGLAPGMFLSKLAGGTVWALLISRARLSGERGE
jgi:hypothetical protein